MERRSATRIGIVILGMVLGLAVVQGTLRSVGQNRSTLGDSLHLPKTPVSYPNAPLRHVEGVPAIKVRSSAEMISNGELQQFLTSNSAPLGIKGLSNVSLSRVDCGMTTDQVSGLLHGKTVGLPPAAAVCYAELNGDFTFALPPAHGSANARSMTVHKGFRVFDAKTGNLLAVGGFQ